MFSKLVGQPLQKVYEFSYHKNLVRLANNIVSELNHELYNEFVLLPSNQQYNVPRYNWIKLKYYFVHQAVLELNKLQEKINLYRSFEIKNKKPCFLFT